MTPLPKESFRIIFPLQHFDFDCLEINGREVISINTGILFHNFSDNPLAIVRMDITIEGTGISIFRFYEDSEIWPIIIPPQSIVNHILDLPSKTPLDNDNTRRDLQLGGLNEEKVHITLSGRAFFSDDHYFDFKNTLVNFFDNKIYPRHS